MNKVERMRIRRNKIIKEYLALAEWNATHNDERFDDEHTLLIEWHTLNEKIISEKNKLQPPNPSPEGYGHGV